MGGFTFKGEDLLEKMDTFPVANQRDFDHLPIWRAGMAAGEYNEMCQKAANQATSSNSGEASDRTRTS
jgi:hypothetical protein